MKSKAVNRQRWQFDFTNQWSDLFGKMNWYDFTVICLEGEYARYSDSVEVRIGLLGLVLTITYRNSFDFIDELDERVKIIDALQNEHPGKTVIDPFGELDKIQLPSECAHPQVCYVGGVRYCGQCGKEDPE